MTYTHHLTPETNILTIPIEFEVAEIRALVHFGVIPDRKGITIGGKVSEMIFKVPPNETSVVFRLPQDTAITTELVQALYDTARSVLDVELAKLAEFRKLHDAANALLLQRQKATEANEAR